MSPIQLQNTFITQAKRPLQTEYVTSMAPEAMNFSEIFMKNTKDKLIISFQTVYKIMPILLLDIPQNLGVNF